MFKLNHYRDIARKLADGLRSGEVVLPPEPDRGNATHEVRSRRNEARQPPTLAQNPESSRGSVPLD